MSRFVEGKDRSQVTLIPECLDDHKQACHLGSTAGGLNHETPCVNPPLL